MSWDAPIRKEMDLVEEEIRRAVASEQELLTDICMHVIGAGGKRIRPGLAILSYKAVGGVDPKKIVGIAAAFELIHSATLIHDDINDHGETRRGRIAAYKKFGVQKSLIAGDFLFVRSFRLGGQWSQKVVEAISDACTATAESEILQDSYENDPSTPLETYYKIISGKTAMPMWAASRVGAILGEGTEDQVEAMGNYGLAVGMAFQIVDDILDVIGDERVLGKPHGADFYDGKPTLPLMEAMKDEELGQQIVELFVKKNKTQKDVERALEMVKKTKGVERARKAARDFADRALCYLDNLDGSPYRKSMSELVEAVLDREA
ncbi:MAG: polyprenyl synthetase family protein [Methanomassiliicoccales archaeon]